MCLPYSIKCTNSTDLKFAEGRDTASDALDVDDAKARYVVFLLRITHLREDVERRQDRAADPHRVLPLGRSADRDLHRIRHNGSELILRTASIPGYIVVNLQVDVAMPGPVTSYAPFVIHISAKVLSDLSL